MLLSSQIAGFFDPQYLLEESINMLQLLNGGNRQGQVESDATPFGSIWSEGNKTIAFPGWYTKFEVVGKNEVSSSKIEGFFGRQYLWKQ